MDGFGSSVNRQGKQKLPRLSNGYGRLAVHHSHEHVAPIGRAERGEVQLHAREPRRQYLRRTTVRFQS